MWNSITYGRLHLEEIPQKLLIFYSSHLIYGEPIEITIGTDSQNHNNQTKIVSVISIICRGHGGIFFHTIEYFKAITDIKKKLDIETNRSLEIAQKLVDLLDTSEFQEIYINCPISIHIDAGNAPYGKTHSLIDGLVGWVHTLGYDCEVKPNSYAASCIADKISK